MRNSKILLALLFFSLGNVVDIHSIYQHGWSKGLLWGVMHTPQSTIDWDSFVAYDPEPVAGGLLTHATVKPEVHLLLPGLLSTGLKPSEHTDFLHTYKVYGHDLKCRLKDKEGKRIMTCAPFSAKNVKARNKCI